MQTTARLHPHVTSDSITTMITVRKTHCEGGISETTNVHLMRTCKRIHCVEGVGGTASRVEGCGICRYKIIAERVVVQQLLLVLQESEPTMAIYPCIQAQRQVTCGGGVVLLTSKASTPAHHHAHHTTTATAASKVTPPSTFLQQHQRQEQEEAGARRLCMATEASASSSFASLRELGKARNGKQWLPP